MSKLLLISLISISCVSCASLMNAYPDSYLEEKIEDAIKASTGLTVDLTGDSPEVPGSHN